MTSSSKEYYINATRAWLYHVVLGLNLCPFAKLPFQQSRIHYEVMLKDDIESLLKTLVEALNDLEQQSKIETTLLIHPNLLLDFYDYLDFMEAAEILLKDLGYEGVFQIASFHPNYQFSGTKVEDVENYTNRSPFPMLHLIREDSITKAVEFYPNVEHIPTRNIDTLRALGISEVKKLYDKL